jgi:hypothetical protein
MPACCTSHSQLPSVKNDRSIFGRGSPIQGPTVLRESRIREPDGSERKINLPSQSVNQVPPFQLKVADW